MESVRDNCFVFFFLSSKFLSEEYPNQLTAQMSGKKIGLSLSFLQYTLQKSDLEIFLQQLTQLRALLTYFRFYTIAQVYKWQLLQTLVYDLFLIFFKGCYLCCVKHMQYSLNTLTEKLSLPSLWFIVLTWIQPDTSIFFSERFYLTIKWHEELRLFSFGT